MMRRETILAGIAQALRAEGDSHPASQYYELFQEALETATGADGMDGLGGHLPAAGHEDSLAGAEKNIAPILLASAIMFAGAEIAHSIRDGLREIAGEIGQSEL